MTIVTVKKCGFAVVGIPDLSSKGAFSFISPNIYTYIVLQEATKNISRQDYPLTRKCQLEEWQPFLLLSDHQRKSSLYQKMLYQVCFFTDLQCRRGRYK